MSRDQGIGIFLALVIHSLALFAFRLSKPPVPFPIGSDPIQVNLVAAAPEQPSLAPSSIQAGASPSAEKARPVSTPEPAPDPGRSPKSSSTPSPLAPAPTPVAAHPPAKIVSLSASKPTRPKATPPTTHKSLPERTAARKPTGPLSKPQSTSTRRGTATGGGRGDIAPSYRSNPQPPYPEEARRLEQQGLVLLDVLVSVEGRAVKVAVKRSSGVRILDQAAVSAVRGWSFQPGRIAGIPAASHVDVPVRFRLDR